MNHYKNEIPHLLGQLQVGNIILYPTDTVWGLGCDVFNEKAVKRIYQIKQREDTKAFIVLMADEEMLSHYVTLTPEISEYLKSERPTTIIYSQVKNLPDYLLASDGSIAIRIPKDDFCHALIQGFGKPIISTSANTSGASTPINYTEIEKSLLHDVDYVVNWRQQETKSAKPSRIIKVEEGGIIQIIRE